MSAHWPKYKGDVHLNTASDQSGTGVTLPISSLDFKAKPYSHTGDTVIELFDGRRKKDIDGWRHEITIEWKQVHKVERDKIFDGTDGFVDLFQNNVTLWFFPDPSDTTKNIEVVADLNNAIQVKYQLNGRRSPAQLKLLSANVANNPKSWSLD